MYNSKSQFKVYVPSRRQVYSKRTFVPTTQYPSGWNLVPRMKDLSEMEFVEEDDARKSTSEVKLTNSDDPEDIVQARLLQNQIEKLSMNKSDEYRTSVMRGNNLIEIKSVDKVLVNDDKYASLEDVKDTESRFNMEDEDLDMNQQLESKYDSNEMANALDDTKMIGNKDNNVSDRVLRSSVRHTGNTHAFVPRGNAMKHVRYEKYYQNELSIMNKELKLEEKEITRHMSIDMISAYRMSVRQAESDKDKVRSESAT